MTSFLFHELLLTSARERRARKVTFHPEITLVKGGNETGKSCLIKSLFRTFGAEPAKVHPNWLAANVHSLVKFEVGGNRFSMLRFGDTFALFDGSDRHMKSFRKVSSELAPVFADLVGFGLRLPNREQNLVPLPPAFYFLPSYMDQDASWSSSWSGFQHLAMFANWKPSVIEYHAGIRGNEYYETRAKRFSAEKDLARVQRKQEGLQEIYSGLQERFDVAQFSVDFSSYQAEVEELLHKCALLRSKEEAFKSTLGALRNKRDALKTQLDIATHAQAEASADFDFSAETGSSDDVECPTCGATYNNSFAERFAIARDEDRCADLALQLAKEMREVEGNIEKELASARAIAAELTGIDRLLAKKEGEIALGDVIRQESRRELREVMNHDIQELQREQHLRVAEMNEYEQVIKNLTDPKHRAAVNDLFHYHMQVALAELDVHSIPDDQVRKVVSPLRATGSELTRALVGYQMSFLAAKQAFGSAAFAPIVIDSPNQQDQDEPHLKMILKYIRDRRPKGSQLILGLVETAGERFGGSTIELVDKYSLLSEGEFDDVNGEVRKFVERALDL